MVFAAIFNFNCQPIGAEKSANQVSSNKSDSSSKTGNSRSKETVTNRSSETSQSKPHNYESVDDATDKSAGTLYKYSLKPTTF